MKHQLIVASMLLVAVAGNSAFAKADKKAKSADPVVMTINGQQVTASEFDYFYNKNSEQELVEEKNFDEYVDLFINYKLKVHEALSRGVDTTQTYIEELAGYRAQLAEPYLTDPHWQDAALQEIAERRQLEVHAAHILIQVNKDASAEMDAVAKAQIEDIKKQAEAGAPFDSLARALSQDPSARQNGGDLGYFSTLQMVYPFENAAFNTEVGQMSICRSSFGYHLIKVMDKRQSKGEVLAAHIMLSFPRGDQGAMKAQQKAKIDSVYQLIKSGQKTFAEACAEFSDDQYTNQRGGEYPWLNSSSRFPKEWMDVAYSLGVGEVSAPFATDFGWHIMTVNDKRQSGEMSEDEKAQLRQQLEHDEDRKAAGVRRQQDRWIAEEGMTFNAKNKSVLASYLRQVADSAMNFEQLVEAAAKMKKKPVLTIAKQPYTASQFVEWFNARYAATQNRVFDIETNMDEWSREMLVTYEDEHLIEKNKEFANLYKEYHDGLLLFAVASGEVWDKAQNDTVGLNNYFQKHQAKYVWDRPRFKGAFVECAADEMLVAKLKEIYENSADYQSAASRVRTEVLTDSLLTPDPKRPRFHIVNGIYAPGDNPTVDRDQLKVSGKPVVPKNAMPVQMTYGKVIAGPEAVDDVRGAVVADYQAELEQAWVAQLRQKFSWSVNQAELNKLKNK